jgi:hypothetical protein
MLRDAGVMVTPAFLAGPLATVSDRGLRVYLVLRARVVRRRTSLIIDGVSVVLEQGEAAFSQRTLRKIVRGGSNQLVRALKELEAAGLMTRTPVMRRALPERQRNHLRVGNATVSTAHTHERYRPGIGGRTVVTRFTLAVSKHLAEVERYQAGNEINTRTKGETSSPLSVRDRLERERVDELLTAEGR